VKYKTRA